jgi:hypothetical protein
MTGVEWQPVPGFPGVRMVDSAMHPPVYVCDVAAAGEEHRKHLTRASKRDSDAQPADSDDPGQVTR